MDYFIFAIAMPWCNDMLIRDQVASTFKLAGIVVRLNYDDNKHHPWHGLVSYIASH